MNTIKVTDYILKELERLGVKHVFGVTGGAVANLIDAFSRSKIKFITCQHEQAAAMAADAYSKINGYGVVMVTSGPGGTNTTTGIASSYFDSTPLLVITGQVSTFDLKKNTVRQRGFQEIDMCKVMEPVTKFSFMVKEPKNVPFILDELIRISLDKRKGPVHLDLPMDVQQGEICIR